MYYINIPPSVQIKVDAISYDQALDQLYIMFGHKAIDNFLKYNEFNIWTRYSEVPFPDLTIPEFNNDITEFL